MTKLNLKKAAKAVINKVTEILISATLLTTSLLLFTACSPTEPAITEQSTVPPKQVDTFIVGESKTALTFTKNAQVQSISQSYIMPQIAGKVTKILVKTGDKVKKGQRLVTLGDSLATDAANLNYEAALKGLDQLDASKFKLDYSAQKDVQSAYMGYYAALENLKSALIGRDHANDLYDEQADSLDDQIDQIRRVLNKLESVPGYESNATYTDLKSKYDQLKSQQKQARIGYDAQSDQLDHAIELSRQSLNSSILAVESVQNKYSIQFIQLDSSIIQAQTGAELAKLQKEAQNITSPIDGTITNIQATENNTTAPGQILLTVENLDNLKIKTSVNENEAPLIKIGNKVKIVTKSGSSQNETLEGTITTISPILSSQDNKISVEVKPDEKSLMSGSLVDVVFTPDTDVIFVPLRIVTIEDTEYFVKLVNDNKEIQKTQIKIGRILGEFIEIISGLKKGDMIAISSTTFLQDGDKVVYKVPFTPPTQSVQ